MPSVVIIDDDENCRVFLERAFDRLAPDLPTFLFPDGGRGLAHLSAAGTSRPLPGLILLDRRLHGGPDGFEVLRIIRSLPTMAAVPVWMFSAAHLPEDVEYARQLGADAYLGKPTGDKYPDLVGRILGLRPWRREEILRPACGSPVALAPAVVSVSLPTREPVVVDIPPRSVDEVPKAHEADDLLRAARLAKIPLCLALKERLRDMILAPKRKRFVVELMKLGWSNSEVNLFVKLSDRYLEDCRSLWRLETGTSRGSGGALPG